MQGPDPTTPDTASPDTASAGASAEASMATGWYALPGGQMSGPHTWEELYRMVQDGRVLANDHVWHSSLPQWVPAAQIPQLVPQIPPVQPDGPHAPQPAYAPQPEYAQYAEPGGVARKRRPWLLPVIISTAVVVLVAAGVGAYLGLRGDGDSSGASAGHQATDKTGTAVVSAGDPVAEIAGVRIDANALNLLDGEKTLTVTAKKPVRDEEDECAYVEYDIDLGGAHQFVAPVTITVPFDAKLVGEGWTGLTHYDADHELWIPLRTQIDEDAATATTSLTSLSPVRMAYYQRLEGDRASLYRINNDGHRNASVDVSNNYWQIVRSVPAKSAQDIAREFLQNGNNNQSVQSFLDADDIAEINTIYTLLGAVGETACVIAKNAPARAVAKQGKTLSNAIGLVGLAIAGVQLVADCAEYGPGDETTATNLMKNLATNGATLISLFTGYSSMGLSLGFAGVAFTGVVLDLAVEKAEELQAATVASIFETYYKDPGMPGHIDDSHWYRVFSEAYYEAWQNGSGGTESYEAAIARLKQEIDRHAERFWDDVYRHGSDALTFAVAEAGERNYYTPEPEHKAYLTAECKRDLYRRLWGTLGKWLDEFMLERMQSETYKALWTAAKPLNDYYPVVVQEIAPIDSAEPCKYQGYTIRFVCISDEGVSFPVTDHPKEWTLVAPLDDDQWAVETDFTLLGYIQAGMPNGVALFPPDSDKNEINDAEHVVEFELSDLADGPTVVDLSGGEDVSGIYNVSGSMRTAILAGSFDEDEFPETQVRVEQNGNKMKITFLDGRDWVLTGTYDEGSQKFIGISPAPHSDNWLDSHIFQFAESIISFDTKASPIQASWKLHKKRIEDETVIDLWGETYVDLKMTKVGDL